MRGGIGTKTEQFLIGVKIGVSNDRDQGTMKQSTIRFSPDEVLGRFVMDHTYLWSMDSLSRVKLG